MPTNLPHHVIIVPADGDPHGLLAEGVCESVPPIVSARYPKGGAAAGPPSWMPFDEGAGRTTRALPLVWDGAIVPEGMDRARRVLAASLGLPEDHGLRWQRTSDGLWALSNGRVAVAFTGSPDPRLADAWDGIRYIGLGYDLPGDVPAPVALAQVLVARRGGRVEVGDAG